MDVNLHLRRTQFGDFSAKLKMRMVQNDFPNTDVMKGGFYNKGIIAAIHFDENFGEIGNYQK